MSYNTPIQPSPRTPARYFAFPFFLGKLAVAAPRETAPPETAPKAMADFMKSRLIITVLLFLKK